MATLLENAARRTSVFQLSWFVVVLAVMPPTAKTFGQDNHPQQPVQQRQQEEQREIQKPLQETSWLTPNKGSATADAGVVPAAPEAVTGRLEQASVVKSPISAGWLAVSLWTVAAIGLILFFLLAGAGAGATVMALRSNAPEKQRDPARYTHPSWRPYTPNLFQRWAFKAERFIRLHFDPAGWKPQQVVRAAAQDAKGRLVRFVPSRRTALRLACFASGIALMILSGFWIVKGQILPGFVLLICGYVIVVAAWLWSWNRGPATSNSIVKEKPQKQEKAPEKVLPSSIVTVQQSRVDQQLVAPAAHLGFSTSTYWHSVDCEQSHRKPVALEFTRRLRCSNCNTQYNVKGKGTLAARRIPCPKCGAALQRAGGTPPKMEPQEPGWAPIISVLCKKCCRLIDVPYASIGKLISCPRCYADLPVPDTEL